MRYFVNGNWINDETINGIPNGAIELSESEWNVRQSKPYQPTPQEQKDRFNANIESQIAVLDLKRIRPLAEGDAVYLAQLTDQIKALRSQLR